MPEPDPDEHESWDMDAEFNYYFAPDPIIRTMVKLVGEGKLSFGITLLMHGLVVSGTVIPPIEWLEGLAATMTRGGPDGESLGAAFATEAARWRAEDQIGDELAGLGTSILQESETNEGDESLDRRPLNLYVHLKDARVWRPGIGGPLPGDEGVFWRGRLTSVDGWFLGTVG